MGPAEIDGVGGGFASEQAVEKTGGKSIAAANTVEDILVRRCVTCGSGR